MKMSIYSSNKLNSKSMMLLGQELIISTMTLTLWLVQVNKIWMEQYLQVVYSITTQSSMPVNMVKLEDQRQWEEEATLTMLKMKRLVVRVIVTLPTPSKRKKLPQIKEQITNLINNQQRQTIRTTSKWTRTTTNQLPSKSRPQSLKQMPIWTMEPPRAQVRELAELESLKDKQIFKTIPRVEAVTAREDHSIKTRVQWVAEPH